MTKPAFSAAHLKAAAAALGRRGGAANTPAQQAWRAQFGRIRPANPGRKPRPDLLEVSLLPSDIGIDLRRQKRPVRLPDEPMLCVFLDQHGRQTRASGPASVVRRALRRHGFTVPRPDRA